MVILGSCALVLMIYGLKIWTEYNGQTPDHVPEFGHFLALWSYGKVLAGHPVADLYHQDRLHALQVALGMPPAAFNPFPYPPTSIPLFRALALLPYGIAYLVWTLGTLALFVWAVAATCSRLAVCLIGVIVAPVTVGCIASGQISFLAAALLTAGVRLAGSRPILGGVLIGLLAYKPQLAILVPVALAAAGYRRAFAAACVTVAVLASGVTMAYGASVWTDWMAMLPAYASVFDHDQVHASLKPTIMANLQLAGVPLDIAEVIQGLASVAVAILVWLCFRRDPGRLAAAALLVGTVLATPHALIYDLPIVAAAMALLIQERMLTRPVFSLGEIAILIFGFTFPLPVLMKIGQFALPVSAVPLLLLFGLILRDAKAAWSKGRSPQRDATSLTSAAPARAP
jgi:hypothetical protein